MSETQQLISIVVPVLNEEDNLDPLLVRVREVFAAIPDYDFEIVFTDNHSSDATFERIVELAASEPRIRAYRFSRNFGYQRSILEGYRRARGAAAIQLDCDLQDPPELIPEFIELWKQGNRVVYGVRAKRAESALVSGLRKTFYRLVNALAEDDLPLDAGDFRLIDASVIEVLRELEDAQPYLRGTIAAMGFRQAAVPYVRSARTIGESKFSWRQMFALSLDGILNHSILPLRLATYAGLTVTVLILSSLVVFVVSRLTLGTQWPAGFATTTVLILLGIALNALFLGIIGEYLGRIYKQVKRGPNTIIERTVDGSRNGDNRTT